MSPGNAQPVYPSALDALDRGMPALRVTQEMFEFTTLAGWKLSHPDAAWGKLYEEVGELEEAILSGDDLQSALDIGEILFCVAHVARWMNLQAEDVALDYIDRRGFVGQGTSLQRMQQPYPLNVRPEMVSVLLARMRGCSMRLADVFGSANEHARGRALGDLLATLAELAAALDIDAEAALSAINDNVERRFRAIEADMAAQAIVLYDLGAEEQEDLWVRAAQSDTTPNRDTLRRTAYASQAAINRKEPTAQRPRQTEPSAAVPGTSERRHAPYNRPIPKSSSLTSQRVPADSAPKPDRTRVVRKSPSQPENGNPEPPVVSTRRGAKPAVAPSAPADTPFPARVALTPRSMLASSTTEDTLRPAFTDTTPLPRFVEPEKPSSSHPATESTDNLTPAIDYSVTAKYPTLALVNFDDEELEPSIKDAGQASPAISRDSEPTIASEMPQEVVAPPPLQEPAAVSATQPAKQNRSTPAPVSEPAASLKTITTPRSEPLPVENTPLSARERRQKKRQAPPEEAVQVAPVAEAPPPSAQAPEAPSTPALETFTLSLMPAVDFMPLYPPASVRFAPTQEVSEPTPKQRIEPVSIQPVPTRVESSPLVEAEPAAVVVSQAKEPAAQEIAQAASTIAEATREKEPEPSAVAQKSITPDAKPLASAAASPSGENAQPTHLPTQTEQSAQEEQRIPSEALVQPAADSVQPITSKPKPETASGEPPAPIAQAEAVTSVPALIDTISSKQSPSPLLAQPELSVATDVTPTSPEPAQGASTAQRQAASEAAPMQETSPSQASQEAPVAHKDVSEVVVKALQVLPPEPEAERTSVNLPEPVVKVALDPLPEPTPATVPEHTTPAEAASVQVAAPAVPKPVEADPLPPSPFTGLPSLLPERPAFEHKLHEIGLHRPNTEPVPYISIPRTPEVTEAASPPAQPKQPVFVPVQLSIAPTPPALPAGAVDALQQYIAAKVRERGHAEQPIHESLLILAEEMGELIKACTKAVRANLKDERERTGKDEIGAEIADVLNMVFTVADALGIDVEAAFRAKESAIDLRRQENTATQPKLYLPMGAMPGRRRFSRNSADDRDEE